jgi:hypothetical protein
LYQRLLGYTHRYLFFPARQAGMLVSKLLQHSAKLALVLRNARGQVVQLLWSRLYLFLLQIEIDGNQQTIKTTTVITNHAYKLGTSHGPVH